MSKIKIKVPSPGESINEVEIAKWLVNNGDYVNKEDIIAEIDSDKATLEISAEESGEINIIAKEGEVVKVGSVIAEIDTSVKKVAETEIKESKKKKSDFTSVTESTDNKKEHYAKNFPSPSAKKLMEENNIKTSAIEGTGKDGRIRKADVLKFLSSSFDSSFAKSWGGTRKERKEKMSMLRRKISQRLVSVKNETAMLTTFNEVDMSKVIELRKKYKTVFKEKFNVGLGFMSFFTKAVTEALALFPSVNASIDGEYIIFHDYADIGIAVSTEKGLMVPVIRNAEVMSLADIEKEIKRLATKAREGKLSIEEMKGGTFTITNGGVFGSMLSTPIINPPQSAILGMHNIVERPIAVNGKVEIRPIMYLALSYDHRIIDGKESVSFLYKIKEFIENPVSMLFGSKKAEEILLGL